MDTNVRKVGREVPGFGYKVRRSDTKSEGGELNTEGMRKRPEARHEGFRDSTRMVRD